MNKETIFLIAGSLIFILIAICFIWPAIKFSKKNIKHQKEGILLPIQAIEIFAFIVMPVLGYTLLYIFRELAELLDWNYIFYVWAFTALSFIFYFLSRTKKHVTGPLTLVLIPAALLTGIILALVQFVHFSPLYLVSATPFIIFILPAFSLLQVAILLSVELYFILQFNKNKVLDSRNKNKLANLLIGIYFGKYSLLVQIITFPLFITIVQFIFLLFNERPDSLLQAFIESSEGLFSNGINDHESHSTASEYLCTIAAFGSNSLVKPLHWGYRQGRVIRVNRQLKVCNAFEEMLSENMPVLHKYLRAGYDGLQIPVEKWKKVKLIANSLYILIKPLELTFLVAVYLFDSNPEARIGRQYLPIGKE